MAKDYHIIRDPIHGFIKVHDLERKIINSYPFQRLRNVKQLALTNLVYPGAEHSRFSHSLGVMEFATKVFDTIVFKHSGELKWDEKRRLKNRQTLRLAALLHDTGHAPFSHASDDLFEEGLDHEAYVPQIIRDTEICEIIDEFPEKAGINVCAKDVINFFTEDDISGDGAFLKEIYAGEVDVDKMDYLLRDSLFAGVNYGKFDCDRLINTLCLIPNPAEEGAFILAIEEGGLHALEALVLARYFMFTQVYFHRVRRAYDIHLLDFLRRKVTKYPRDTREFLLWDDIRVLQMMRDDEKDEDAQCILNRRHFVEVFHTQEHCTDVEKTRFMWLKEKVVEKFPDIRILFDEAEKAPHKFKKIDFYVKERDGNVKLVTEASGIIDNLKKIEEFRIYVNKTNAEAVNKFCKEFWSQKQKI